MSDHLYDFVIIGGGLSGLTAAEILTNQGFDTCLIEKSPHLGSHSTSFRNDSGDSFDYGYHALDYNRSELTTDFFQRVLNDEVRRFPLHRGTLLRGHLIPYNAPITEWPEALRGSSNKTTFTDDIDGAPTEARLRSIYGDAIVDLACNEALSSYALQRWRLENRAPKEELFAHIYPWFFPAADKQTPASELPYHDRVRLPGETQEILYPTKGGFGSFIEGIHASCDHSHLRTILDLPKVQIDADLSTKVVSGIDIGDEVIRGRKYLWCAPIFGAAKFFGLKMPSLHPQELHLASLAFEEDIQDQFHEILSGDPAFMGDRISFPDAIAGTGHRLLQFEYFRPRGESPLESEIWIEDCLDYLKDLEIVPQSAKLKETHYFTAPKGFLTSDNLAEVVAGYEAELKTDTTNLFYPHVGFGPENINRVIPNVHENIAAMTASLS